MTLLYGFAAYRLYDSGVSLLGKLVCGLVLVGSMVFILKNPRPYRDLKGLEYNGHHWILTHQAGQTQTFERHRVLLDVGVFFLLHLSSTHSRQTLVIFHDQIGPDDYRSLRILEKII